MRVRHKIAGTDLEVNIQQRTVTTATIRHKGKIVAQGEAILNPQDKNDPLMGWKIGLGRAFKSLLGLKAFAKLKKEVDGDYTKLTDAVFEKAQAKDDKRLLGKLEVTMKTLAAIRAKVNDDMLAAMLFGMPNRRATGYSRNLFPGLGLGTPKKTINSRGDELIGPFSSPAEAEKFARLHGIPGMVVSGDARGENVGPRLDRPISHAIPFGPAPTLDVPIPDPTNVNRYEVRRVDARDFADLGIDITGLTAPEPKPTSLSHARDFGEGDEYPVASVESGDGFSIMKFFRGR